MIDWKMYGLMADDAYNVMHVDKSPTDRSNEMEVSSLQSTILNDYDYNDEVISSEKSRPIGRSV